LGEELDSANGYPELKNYWFLQGGKYHFVNGTINFPQIQYGQVEVTAGLIPVIKHSLNFV
jgi:hypothetical protein